MGDGRQSTNPAEKRRSSVFDQFPPGEPLDLARLELAMAEDVEGRTLAALDRALARLAARRGEAAGGRSDPPSA